ncbi:unnamed protein product, partial [Rotaria sp. Silwood1]
HYAKLFHDDSRETVPDLSTAVYERRSYPEDVHFCLCETVRCDAEVLRANSRLVTEWDEIKPLDNGAFYARSRIFAIYAFAFGPHCKRCQSYGQWSHYVLPELVFRN